MNTSTRTVMTVSGTLRPAGSLMSGAASELVQGADPAGGGEVGEHHDDGQRRHRARERQVVGRALVVVDDVAEQLRGAADDLHRDVVTHREREGEDRAG